MMSQVNKRNSFGPGYFQNEGGGMGSIVVPKQMVEPVALPLNMMIPKHANPPQYVAIPNQNQRYNPVSFGPNLRGVNSFCSFLLVARADESGIVATGRN
jgi:hypothetical protein